jgi:type II secretory pathway pseudopilin PulG
VRRLYCRSGPARHGGFLLFEALLASAVIALLFAAALPKWDDAVAERELDQSARQVAAAIRRAQIEAKNSYRGSDMVMRGVTFICGTEDDGRVHYKTKWAFKTIRPYGVLPPGITSSSSRLFLRFSQDGFAGRGKKYYMKLETADRRFRRELTVALYTGRVRIT